MVSSHKPQKYQFERVGPDMFSCALCRQWGAISWTIVALQLARRVLAQTEPNNEGDDDDEWNAVVGLVVALVALGVLVVCLLVALCESRRNRKDSGPKENPKPELRMVGVQVQIDPPSPPSSHSSEKPVPVERTASISSEEQSEVHEPRTVFDKIIDESYEASAILAGGSNATIWKGAQFSTSRGVVLKVFQDADACLKEHAFYSSMFNPQDPEVANQAKNFIPELIDGGQFTVSDISHPAIVLEKGSFTLKDFISPKKRKQEYVVFSEKSIIYHICACLRFLHRSDHIHGDLHPGSIMFFGSRWKLLDFCAVGITGQLMNYRPRPGFGAPEVLCAVASGEEYVKANPAIDVWAFGSIAYELMTRKPLLPQSNFTAEEIESMAFGQRSFPWEERPYAFWGPIKSPAATKIIQNCLHRDPGKRWTIEKVIQYTQFWS